LKGKTWHRVEAGLVLLASFVLAALVIRNRSAVEATLSTIGPISYPIAIVVFAMVASAPFSVTDALAVMNGVIFGPLWGSIVNAVGLVLAALVSYAIALRTSHLLELESNIQRLPRWVKRFKVGSPPFLLTLRIIPGVGGTLATQIAAALKIPLFVHVWTFCLVTIPVCTLLAIFGDRISTAVHDYYEAHKPNVHINQRVHDMFHHHRAVQRPESKPT